MYHDITHLLTQTTQSKEPIVAWEKQDLAHIWRENWLSMDEFREGLVVMVDMARSRKWKAGCEIATNGQVGCFVVPLCMAAILYYGSEN